jgi:hypothetical protein
MHNTLRQHPTSSIVPKCDVHLFLHWGEAGEPLLISGSPPARRVLSTAPRPPIVNPGRGLVRQVNGGIFSSPPLLELEASRARKIPGHTALPAPINGGRQSLAAPHPAIEPQQPSLAPPPPPIAPPPLASAAARTAPRSRLPKQPQPKMSTGMRSPRSPLRLAPLSSIPKYTLNLKFFHQNTPVIFR